MQEDQLGSYCHSSSIVGMLKYELLFTFKLLSHAPLKATYISRHV